MRAARVALAIANNVQHGVPARPSWCTWLVTYRCNARCGMCDSWRLKPGNELTAEEAARVFARIGPLEVVRLTGGEPFLRHDFDLLAEAVLEGSDPLVLHVTTNGSFPDRVERFARGFPEPSRLRFLVSFDGHREEHDRSRGEDVTYDLALDTVRRLRHLGFPVAANHTVISQRSMDDHEALRAELTPMGVMVQAVLAYADSAMYTIKLRGKRAEGSIPARGYPLHPALAGADAIGFTERQLERVDELPLTERIGKRYYLRGLLARLRGEEEPQPHPPCVALRSHLRLLPDGRVPVCQFNTEAVGNLAGQPFEAVWHGAAAVAQRAWVDGCSGCWAECEVVPNAIFSGDLLRTA